MFQILNDHFFLYNQDICWRKQALPLCFTWEKQNLSSWFVAWRRWCPAIAFNKVYYVWIKVKTGASQNWSFACRNQPHTPPTGVLHWESVPATVVFWLKVIFTTSHYSLETVTNSHSEEWPYSKMSKHFTKYDPSVVGCFTSESSATRSSKVFLHHFEG